jgi:hypothetical protein
MILAPASVFAGTSDYGAAGATGDPSLTLDEMLKYAIQDEYLAKAEYVKIMDQFDVTRPFSNIMKAELQHISALEPLFDKYDVILPENTSSDYLVIPSTLEEIYAIGVKAEVDNIAMYEKFLAQGDLPDDVKAVFTALQNASENHLKAFERAEDRPVASSGNANGNGFALGKGFRNGNSDASAVRPRGNNTDGLGSANRAVDGNGLGTGLGTGLQDGSCLE